MKREMIIPQSRTHIGTPFGHLGRLKGYLEDCAGHVELVCEELGTKFDLPRVYEKSPDALLFKETVEKYMDKILLSEAQPGDCLIFAFAREPQHIAFISNIEPLHIIHAFSTIGKVVEQGLDDKWMKRIRGCYRFKDIEE